MQYKKTCILFPIPGLDFEPQPRSTDSTTHSQCRTVSTYKRHGVQTHREVTNPAQGRYAHACVAQNCRGRSCARPNSPHTRTMTMGITDPREIADNEVIACLHPSPSCISLFLPNVYRAPSVRRTIVWWSTASSAAPRPQPHQRRQQHRMDGMNACLAKDAVAKV